MKNEKKNHSEMYQEAADKLLKMFASGKMPEAVAFHIIRKQAGVNYKPSDTWSLGNQILQALHDTDDARGYKQWAAVGRYVRKGSHAIYILAPLTRKIKETDSVTGLEKEKIIITGFRPVPVFRYEDTDGAELENMPEYIPSELPPFWDVAAKMGIKVRYSPLTSNFLGQYNISHNSIRLCANDAVVYFHELAHAVHNTFRDLRHCDDATAEVVAEFSAVTMARIQGIEGYEQQAWDYIRKYTRSNEPEKALKFIMQVLGDVEKIVTRVLDAAYEEEKAPVQEAV